MLEIDKYLITRWITSRRGGVKGVQLCATPLLSSKELMWPVGQLSAALLLKKETQSSKRTSSGAPHSNEAEGTKAVMNVSLPLRQKLPEIIKIGKSPEFLPDE